MEKEYFVAVLLLAKKIKEGRKQAGSKGRNKGGNKERREYRKQ
jgi:hypothetical protein